MALPEPKQNRNIEDLKPHVQVKLKKALLECHAQWCPVKISEWLRTRERQDRLLGKGRTAWDLENNRGVDGKYAQPTKAKVTRVYTSNHQLWCAVDIFFNIPGDIYRDSKRPWVSEIFKKNWFVWGFDKWWVDKPHFEDDGIPLEEEDESISYYKWIYMWEWYKYQKIKNPEEFVTRWLENIKKDDRETLLRDIAYYVAVWVER